MNRSKFITKKILQITLLALTGTTILSTPIHAEEDKDYQDTRLNNLDIPSFIDNFRELIKNIDSEEYIKANSLEEDARAIRLLIEVGKKGVLENEQKRNFTQLKADIISQPYIEKLLEWNNKLFLFAINIYPFEDVVGFQNFLVEMKQKGLIDGLELFDCHIIIWDEEFLEVFGEESLDSFAEKAKIRTEIKKELEEMYRDFDPDSEDNCSLEEFAKFNRAYIEIAKKMAAGGDPAKFEFILKEESRLYGTDSFNYAVFEEECLIPTFKYMMHFLTTIANKEFQERAWIQGLGPLKGNYEKTIKDYNWIIPVLLHNPKEFKMTDSQSKMLHLFHEEFKVYTNQEEINFTKLFPTPEWDRIVQIAKEVVGSFDYKDDITSIHDREELKSEIVRIYGEEWIDLFIPTLDPMMNIFSMLANREFQERVWVDGSDSQVGSYRLVLESYFSIASKVLKNPRKYEITDIQYEVLKKFHEEFETITNIHKDIWFGYLIETPEWNKIVQMAQEILISFNYKKDITDVEAVIDFDDFQSFTDKIHKDKKSGLKDELDFSSLVYY